MSLPTVNSEQTFAVEVAHEDVVLEGQVAYMQCALLYTNSGGERRIRVHTLVIPVVTSAVALFQAVDAAALTALMARSALDRALHGKLADTCKHLQNKLGLAMREYRRAHARSNPSPSSLIFPAAMRYLTLYTLGLLRTVALRGTPHTVPTDDRSASSFHMEACSVPALLRLIYPAVYPLHITAGDWGRLSPHTGRVSLPEAVPPTTAAINPEGAYLVENGLVAFLYIGGLAPEELVEQLLGPMQSQQQMTAEPPRGSELSQRLNALLGDLRAHGTASHTSCYAIRQGTPNEQFVLPLLVEDRCSAEPSYVDFVGSIARSATAKIS